MSHIFTLTKLTEEISAQFVQQFEEDKNALIEELSKGLNESQTLKQLEGNLRYKLKEDNQQYMEDQIKKKTQLLRLNLSKKYEQESIQINQRMNHEFNERMEQELEKIRQVKKQIQQDYENEQLKLNLVDQEKKKFRLEKQNQESHYSAKIEELQSKIQQLHSQINHLKQKSPVKKAVSPKKEDDKVQKQLSPYAKSLNNKIEMVEQEFNPDFVLINEDDAPDLLDSDRLRGPFDSKPSSPLLKAENDTQQTLSFTISQPSLSKQQKLDQFQTLEKSQSPQQTIKIYPDTVSAIGGTNINSSMNTMKGSILDNLIRLEKICKDRLESKMSKENENFSEIANTTNKRNPAQIPDRSQQKLDNFEQLFQFNPKDTPSIKQVKQLRRDLQAQANDDFQLEDFYYQQIAYLKLNFVSQFDAGDQEEVQVNVEKLVNLWNKGLTMFSKLLMQGMDQNRQYEISDPINELCQQVYDQQNFVEQNQKLIEKLQQRSSFRSQIIKENFEYSNNRRIFTALKHILNELLVLNKESGGRFVWREVEVSQILKIDQFEQDLLEKEQVRKEVKKKVENKFR